MQTLVLRASGYGSPRATELPAAADLAAGTLARIFDLDAFADVDALWEKRSTGWVRAPHALRLDLGNLVTTGLNAYAANTVVHTGSGTYRRTNAGTWAAVSLSVLVEQPGPTLAGDELDGTLYTDRRFDSSLWLLDSGSWVEVGSGGGGNPSTLYDATAGTPSMIADDGAVTVQEGVDFTSHGKLSKPPDGFTFNGHIFPTWFDPGETHWNDAGWFAFDFDGSAHLWVAQHWGFGSSEGASVHIEAGKRQFNLFLADGQTDPAVAVWDPLGTTAVATLGLQGGDLVVDGYFGYASQLAWMPGGHAQVYGSVDITSAGAYESQFSTWTNSPVNPDHQAYINAYAEYDADGNGAHVRLYTSIEGTAHAGELFQVDQTLVNGLNVNLRADFGQTTAVLKVMNNGAGGIFEVRGDNKIGFFAAPPVVKPTGVAVTAAGVHAALVTLGLIAA